MSNDDIKVIIAGSRKFNDWDFLTKSIYSVLVPRYEEHDIEFISGGARGADKMGEMFADVHWQSASKVFKPDYKKHGRYLAPLRRNREMAAYSVGGILIAFLAADVKTGERGQGGWQVTGGTSNMIMNALAYKMDLHIFRFRQASR